MQRPIDTVRVEIVAANGRLGGSLDNFTSLQIVNDITAPSSASFELGNDGTFPSLQDQFTPGALYRVFVNDLLRLAGRVEDNDLPLDASAGSVVRFTVRTKLSDAMYSSARQSVRVKNTSIKQFVLDVYAPLGYAESDFIFRSSESRDLMTGVPSGNQGNDAPVDLEKIKVEEARVKPPETIYAAVDRHLRRHGLMHWDAPDGKIVIGAPNDLQDPQYVFNAYRDPSKSYLNNILGMTKVRDISGMPTAIGIFGIGGKRDFTKSRVAGFAQNDQMAEWGFYRPLVMPAEAIRTQANANRAAAREMSARSKGFDTYVMENDGLSFWDGSSKVNYGIDTVASVNSDISGGAQGAYYVHRVELTRNAAAGDAVNLNMLARGLWRL
jgi:hypothetical protein